MGNKSTKMRIVNSAYKRSEVIFTEIMTFEPDLKKP